MYTIIYRFEVIESETDKFIQAWRQMTEFIYQFEGSLGSRLHRESKNNFIAYAQWPSQAMFDNAGHKLPKEAEVVRQALRESCESIETLFKAEVVMDLLK